MGKKVLVLGSTGAMGQYIVPYLADMGYEVCAVSLADEVPYNERVTCIKGNAKDKEFLTGLLSQRFDGIVDFMLRNRTPEFKAYILRELVEKVWPKIESGAIQPSIYKILPIEQAEEAHAILQRSENIGKVVLSVCSPDKK